MILGMNRPCVNEILVFRRHEKDWMECRETNSYKPICGSGSLFLSLSTSALPFIFPWNTTLHRTLQSGNLNEPSEKCHYGDVIVHVVGGLTAIGLADGESKISAACSGRFRSLARAPNNDVAQYKNLWSMCHIKAY